MVQKLISGGQTGADQCILAISRRLGIPIDGLVPKGWLTEAGPQPLLGQLGFRESDSADYRVRTRRNVEQGDATLIFATDPDSDGTGLTIEHASQLRKPWLLVDPFDDGAVQKVRAWLVVTQPAVLNVAGNRESKSPGIAQQAERVLYAVLSAQRDQ